MLHANDISQRTTKEVIDIFILFFFFISVTDTYYNQYEKENRKSTLKGYNIYMYIYIDVHQIQS